MGNNLRRQEHFAKIPKYTIDETVTLVNRHTDITRPISIDSVTRCSVQCMMHLILIISVDYIREFEKLFPGMKFWRIDKVFRSLWHRL